MITGVVAGATRAPAGWLLDHLTTGKQPYGGIPCRTCSGSRVVFVTTDD